MCCSCCLLECVGVSVVLTPAAAMSAAGAAPTHVAAPDTVSINTHTHTDVQRLVFRIFSVLERHVFLESLNRIVLLL